MRLPSQRVSPIALRWMERTVFGHLFPGNQRPGTSGVSGQRRFRKRPALTGLLASATGNNTFATAEVGEPPHAGSKPRDRSTVRGARRPQHAIGHRRLESETGGVYGASVAALNSVASSVGDDTTDTTVVTFNAVAGTTYFFAIDRSTEVARLP